MGFLDSTMTSSVPFCLSLLPGLLVPSSFGTPVGPERSVTSEGIPESNSVAPTPVPLVVGSLECVFQVLVWVHVY